jgi:hypothetical protein
LVIEIVEETRSGISPYCTSKFSKASEKRHRVLLNAGCQTSTIMLVCSWVTICPACIIFRTYEYLRSIESSMDPKDIPELIKAFTSLKHAVGLYAAIAAVLLVIAGIISWQFVIKKVEKAAETASEKTLKKFQAKLDRDNARFQSQHDKQMNALEAIYQPFTSLSSMIRFTMKGEKFTAEMGANEQVQLLVQYRHQFKTAFQQNKLRLSNELCARIEALLPVVDEFIEAFEGGMMPGYPEPPDEVQESGLYIAAMWPPDLLDGIIVRIDGIANDIEKDFRNAYGTA